MTPLLRQFETGRGFRARIRRPSRRRSGFGIGRGVLCAAWRARQRLATGITLIELLVTVAVLAVLLTVGVPTVVSLVHNTRVTSLAGELSATLSLARSEAIRRGAPVSVCASSSGAACGGAWSDGWIVIVDGEADPLRVQGTRGGKLGPREASGRGRVVFGALGALLSEPMSFSVGDPGVGAGRLRQVDLTVSGRVRVADGG